MKIKIFPENIVIEAKSQNLLSALNEGGIYINSTCGGAGTCGKCRVKILKGKYAEEENPFKKQKGVVLACKTKILSDLEIEIPPSSRIENYFTGERGIKVREVKQKIEVRDPIVEALKLKVKEPDTNFNISDAERTLFSAQKEKISLNSVRKLPEVLRKNSHEIFAFCFENEIIDASKDSSNFGLCIDIGTTTIVTDIIDLEKGEIVKNVSCYNPQIALGEDVITRIIKAEGGNLEELSFLVVTTLNKMIEKSGVAREKIKIAIASGNTTMMHLLFKINPAHIRRKPYIPATRVFPVIKALELGIKINSDGLLLSVPANSSWVGGDIVSGIIYSRLYEEEKPCMFIDFGTNGEVVIGCKDFLIATSTSAGPCFEGGTTSSGVRAMEGAINKFYTRDKKIKFETIGGKKPIGICGVGYISLLKCLLENGIILRDGKFKDGKEEFVIYEDEKILVTQADIKNLINAKAAIFSGIKVLTEKLNLTFSDIEKIYIAGALGFHIDMEEAVFIGLLPDVPREKFQYLGNSSLKGAELMCADKSLYRKALKLYEEITYIDLAEEPSYMDEYMSSSFFPHTDIGLFESYREAYKKISEAK